VAIVRRNVAEVIIVSRPISRTPAALPVRTRGFKFLRVIYIGVDKLVSSEQRRESHTNMDAIYLAILLVLLLATIGLVLGIDRIGEDR
jgi:hypothetical protein